MAPRGYKEAKVAFLTALGEGLLAWNSAENFMRYLLTVLSGKQPSTYVLTAELGSTGIVQALRAISVTQAPQITEAIKSVCTYYEALRSYRNYYVHGISSVGFGDGGAIGIIAMMEAKGILRIAEDKISLGDLSVFIDRALLLKTAVLTIIDTVDIQEGSMATPVLPTHQSLPPPDKLEKTLRYPLGSPPNKTS